MPKKSKKSKSKRVSLKKKYKVIKKVKEHHKKKAKEAKKLEKRPKIEKDPGIPAAWPFREQELAQLEAKRARTLEEIERKKQEKKARRTENKRKFGAMETSDDEEDDDIAELAKEAANRDTEFEKRKKARMQEKVQNASLKDGSKRAYWKEFQKVVESADVIIEVLDARDPLGSRCKEVERMVLRNGPQKRVVLLLNKIDLVPREVAEQWLKYLREELPTVAFKCSTQNQKANLGQKALPSATAGPDALQTSETLGADTLIQLLKNYSRNLQLKTSITVGIIGFPNVGKSSLINSLKRARVAQVGSTPGVTKTMQEVHLDKHVKLLDCPGIVFASAPAAEGGEAAAALRNCVKVEKLEDPVTPVKEILRLCPSEKLMSIYKVSRFRDVDGFLNAVALARGKLKKGGIADKPAAAKLVLQDWNAGKIPYYTSPPERTSDEPAEAQLVASWGKEFDVEEVFKNEQSTVIQGLPSLQEGEYTKMPARAPLAVDMEGAEEESEPQEDSEPEEESEPSGSEMDDDEVVVEKKFDHKHRGRDYLNQAQQLYNEEGMFNPHAARTQRKQKKKSATNQPSVGSKKKSQGDNDGSDYDFGADFQDDGADVGGHEEEHAMVE